MAEEAHAPIHETCMICNQLKSEGLHIGNQLICDSCRRTIVKTDVTDWKYGFLIKKLSQLNLIDQTKETTK
ncbi:sigma factor G inhibitor Gin [Sporolactobacillus sp. Y61]|jgi:hypothetical protein|uniref:Sigma factor G inhibitor Gin n=1 Tax=Sporolactobacillus sp. Y61 TaxID=3160863 RepID=A0AAU8IHF7_9BACL|nr:sigma factor G inhibitor Gin [Sporolactobacillus sp. THM19-2]RYL89800.1 inhibitor of sigma-G Gin [Sporolactobacillus sp. THM19-2]